MLKKPLLLTVPQFSTILSLNILIKFILIKRKSVNVTSDHINVFLLGVLAKFFVEL